MSQRSNEDDVNNGDGGESAVLSLSKEDLRAFLVNLPASARYDLQVDGVPVGDFDEVLSSSDWFIFKRVEGRERVTYVVNAVSFSDLENSLEED